MLLLLFNLAFAQDGTVIVATANLRAGHVITEEDVFALGWDQRFRADNTLSHLDAAMGRRVFSDILAGEPLRTERLSRVPDDRRQSEPSRTTIHHPLDCERTTPMVAMRTLEAGHTIVEDDLYAVLMPCQWIPYDAITSPEWVVGTTAKADLLANEIIRTPRVTWAINYVAEQEAQTWPNRMTITISAPINVDWVDVVANGCVLVRGKRVSQEPLNPDAHSEGWALGIDVEAPRADINAWVNDGGITVIGRGSGPPLCGDDLTASPEASDPPAPYRPPRQGGYRLSP